MARIITRSQALTDGFTDSELRRLCRDGTLTRLRRGAYAGAPDIENLTDTDRHLLVVRATMARATAPDTVSSHASAALLHGITLWDVPLGTVHLTRNRRTGGRRGQLRTVHASPYDPDEVTEVEGLRVTTVARTIADLACSLPFEQAVCAADDAARRLGVLGTEVAAVLARRPTRNGHARALRVARFMNAGAESVGESRSRVLLHESGFVVEVQRMVHCANRSHRVDFFLPESNVVGEFDGRVKYGRLVPTGDTPADVLWREKLREDEIRDTGYEMARWTWGDLEFPESIIGRIRRAKARSARRT
ncbi:type IV toxin-antitoxin system AbiEi family antitoxin domain-containing protein [Rhodococcus sp. BP-316]|uniref:type IV toxin-antitoxin system AbiEi family antitoxin domain-containing protein n=1 Tax=Rhodococcus sp. BP-316 TaxID=2739445 RepID=UPI001C9B9E72|nr:type IV toxin-antitoxin system AbiEi family antitoxin domain-containing protein [Rhodococcus sp. BP-316]MBY6683182.1 type IV toxin-antitoxin system AbiEi family antitoxin domain-containing protein [Rhodococcus sp. BP-316]